MRAVVADVLLNLPVFKHLFQLMGCVSAGKPVMHEFMVGFHDNDRTGQSCRCKFVDGDKA